MDRLPLPPAPRPTSACTRFQPRKGLAHSAGRGERRPAGPGGKATTFTARCTVPAPHPYPVPPTPPLCLPHSPPHGPRPGRSFFPGRPGCSPLLRVILSLRPSSCVPVIPGAPVTKYHRPGLTAQECEDRASAGPGPLELQGRPPRSLQLPGAPGLPDFASSVTSAFQRWSLRVFTSAVPRAFVRIGGKMLQAPFTTVQAFAAVETVLSVTALPALWLTRAVRCP